MIRAVIALTLVLAPLSALAASCHTALALALDISDSVDADEADLQRIGLATALKDPAVRAAILPQAGQAAAMMAFEWNDPSAQRVIAPWSLLSTAGAIDAFAAKIADDPATELGGQTGIGAALRFAARSFAEAPPCDRQVIDVSGDGPGNTGVPPQSVRRSGLLDGVTVNGLVIRNPALDSAQPPARDPLPYYQKNVKWGPGAFVIVIDRYEDYADAIRRKLLRELSPSFAALAAPAQ